FRAGRVMGMFCSHRSNISMTPNTHFVRPVPVLERCGIVGRVRWVRIVAIAATGLASTVTSGAHESLHDKRGLAKPSIFVKGAPGKLDEWPARIRRCELILRRCILDLACRPQFTHLRLL